MNADVIDWPGMLGIVYKIVLRKLATVYVVNFHFLNCLFVVFFFAAGIHVLLLVSSYFAQVFQLGLTYVRRFTQLQYKLCSILLRRGK